MQSSLYISLLLRKYLIKSKGKYYIRYSPAQYAISPAPIFMVHMHKRRIHVFDQTRKPLDLLYISTDDEIDAMQIL